MGAGALPATLSVFGLSLVLAVLAAPAAAATARPLFTGVTNIGPEPLLGYQQVRGAGARFVRIPLYWKGTAPQRQPNEWSPTDPFDSAYAWNASDDAVRNAVAAGLLPVLQVEGAPTWAQRCQTPPALGEQSLCDPDPAALAAFATAAASRYSGRFASFPRVQYWQALNEPNVTLFFFPQYDTSGRALSPALYRDLVNSFYAAVKSVDDSNLVLAAGLGPNAVPPWTIGPMRFARQLLCMRGTRRPKPVGGVCGDGVHFDIFAIQPYTTGSPAHEGKVNDVQLGDLSKLQALIKAADRADRIVGRFKRTPLWITEFSWDSNPPDPGGLPMKTAQQWTAQALHAAWGAGVTHFFWYSLRDAARRGSYKEGTESGLYFRGPSLERDVAKPLLGAFRFPFVAYARPQGLPFWGRTPNSRGGRVTIQVLRGRKWRNVQVVRANRSGIFRGLARFRYGRNGRGRARAVYRKQASPSFPMNPVGDFYHPPLG